MLVTVVVLMIMMVRFVMLVVITGLRQRTTSGSETERYKSDQYIFHSQWSLNDTDFSEHQKLVAIFPSRAQSLVVLGPRSFFSTSRNLISLR